MFADTGHLTLVKADPAGYAELARAKVCGPTWAHPALVGGRLYHVATDWQKYFGPGGDPIGAL